MLYFAAYLIGNFFSAAEKQAAARHIKPAFVNAEWLYHIGIFLVNSVRLFGILLIFIHHRRQNYKLGTFCPRLENCLRGFNAAALCSLVFGKHNAVPLLLVPAYGNRHGTQGGIEKQRNGRKKIIKITVKNYSFLRFCHPAFLEHLFLL